VSRERLTREAHKFKNIATCFGKTRLKDDKGQDLFLNCLDIDSDNVYFILFNLDNVKTGRQYSLTAGAQECTFVTKTKKPNGFHIFWLSRRQNDSISTYDCKKGYEFEIKTDKNGLCTLPPSNHRDDPAFCYKNYGQNKIVISDIIHDEIMNLLSDCLKDHEKCDFDHKSKSAIRHVGALIELSDADVQIICDSICSCYHKGGRHSIVYGLCGLFHKHGVSQESAINVIQILAKDDEERRSRLAAVKETYSKDPKTVSGSKYFVDVLEHTSDHAIAKEILEKILRIIGGGQNPVLWLTEAIMKEYTFKTIKDNDEIYYYDSDKGS
jgi:hypothetical protein